MNPSDTLAIFIAFGSGYLFAVLVMFVMDRLMSEDRFK